MNKNSNKVLLVGDKFIPEMHSRQPGRIQKFKEREDTRYIYQSKPDKASLQNDMA